MKRLLSHYQPTLTLEEHVYEVRRAANFLLNRHRWLSNSGQRETAGVLDAVVRIHDTGKGGPAFQEYIRNPAGYRGDRFAKAHSSLSAALGILWARSQGWQPLDALILAQAGAGHHSGFQSMEDLSDVRLQPDDDGIVEKQWRGMDRQAIGHAVGLDLSGVTGSFKDAWRWLFLQEEVDEQLRRLSLEEAVEYRLRTQLVFSILLEADKALLALRLEKGEHYFSTVAADLSPDKVERHVAAYPRTPVNELRNKARTRVLSNADGQGSRFSLTLPTGLGKTLTAAQWALLTRSRMAVTGTAPPPKIIIALPFLSIIDQTEQVYRQVLDTPGRKGADPVLMASHSLCERRYELEDGPAGERHAEFFLDTWRSDIVITTFDQLLLALFSSAPRHLLRFHQLWGAIIVLDEVQAIPARLWDPVDRALSGLVEAGGGRILVMSATQPALLRGACELVGDERSVAAFFSHFRRYRIILNHVEPQSLETFIDRLSAKVPDWISRGERVLVTLNTRASARSVFDALDPLTDPKTYPCYLLSADVTPMDRLEKIAAIKSDWPCLVISTQTVEAGVDIDMDHVIRDFAPLDSLIQVAGRCNRNNNKGAYGGRVEVVSLLSERGRSYAEMVYDRVLLDITKEVLDGVEILTEEAVLDYSRRYFALVQQRRDTGRNLTRDFAHWRSWPRDVQTLLRGDRHQRVSLTVLAQNDDRARRLLTDLEQVCAMQDRWEKRSALRRLAARLQTRTVTIYARPGFSPDDYARRIGNFRILDEGYYTKERGLELPSEKKGETCIF